MLENISRRKMLRSLGVVGASSVILSPTDVASANEAREVEILTGDQRERTIQAAQDDPEFQKIIRKFKKIGNPNYENSICDRVQPDDGDPYTFIVLSFESNNKDTQINAVWMDRSVDGQMPRILGHKATLNSSSKWEIAVTTIDKNSGETTTKQNTLQIGDEASVAPGDIAEPPPGGGGDGCVVEIVTCDSWDWDCILGWVATATTTIA